MFILLMNELNRIRRKVAHVKENFSAEKIAKKTIDIYEEIVEISHE